MDGGEHRCYLAADFFDPRDALWDEVPPPGRYPIAYETTGHHEQFEATLRLIPAPVVVDGEQEGGEGRG